MMETSRNRKRIRSREKKKEDEKKGSRRQGQERVKERKERRNTWIRRFRRSIIRGNIRRIRMEYGGI